VPLRTAARFRIVRLRMRAKSGVVLKATQPARLLNPAAGAFSWSLVAAQKERTSDFFD